MKQLPKPHVGVIQTGKVLYYLLKKDKINIHKVEPNDSEWRKVKVMMAKPKNFLAQVFEYSEKDATRIPKVKKENVKKILALPEFQPHIIKTKAKAAGALCDWAHNIIRFNEAYLIVDPLEKEKNAALQLVEEKTAQLKEVQAKVKDIKDNLAVLEAELSEAMKQKEEVEEKMRVNEEKKNIAVELVDGLASNQIRWSNKRKELEKEVFTVIGDTLISAEFVQYIGAFSKAFREDLVKNKWMPDILERKIPCTDNIDPL